MPLPRLRIFLSSPGDVGRERLRANLVIQKLARDYARFFAIEPFLWEYEPMLASKHFQDAIEPPGSCDIVVLVLWSRLGTMLPEKTAVREYRGIDGRAPVTGTEWEFEDAVRANRSTGGKGPPDLLAYRRIGGVVAVLDDASARDEKIKEYDALETFWRRWFRSGDQLLAGFYEYQELEEFDHRLEADLAKLIERRIKERSLVEEPPLWLRGSPFRGLDAYDFVDAPLFFGREGETREGLTRLAEAAARGTGFLLITGASGAGKSSLARAGLLFGLVTTKAVADVGLWRRVVMRPGDAGGEPVLALARALTASDGGKGEGLAELTGQHMSAEELANDLVTRGDPVFLFTKTLRELAEAERDKHALLPHEEARLIIVVDQLEELFTRPEIPSEQRARFGEVVAALVRAGVWVIATMRSDLAHRLDEVKHLNDLAKRGAHLMLPPPDAAQLLEIIRQAARAAGLAFDTDPASGLGLDALLAREAAAEPGVLPLLSVMLADLYYRDVATGSSGGVLTFATYHALGGLRTAIGERAERRLQTLERTDAAAAGALPRVLRSLVAVGTSGVGAAVRPQPVAIFAEGSPERRLVDVLIAADARLLTVEDRGRGPEVRLAHEALIESWPRAKTIVSESSNFFRVRDDVDRQRARWEATKRRKDLLLASGLPLAEAQDLVEKFGDEITPGLRTFVMASRRRARVRQRLVAGAAVFFFLLAVVASTAGIMAYYAEQDATRERDHATQQEALAKTQLAAAQLHESQFSTVEAEQLLDAGQPELAGLIARAALPADMQHPDRQFWAPAVRVLAQARDRDRLRAALVGHKNSINESAFSPDGTRLITASTDGTARIWDARSGALLRVLEGHTDAVTSASWNPDSSRIATASADKTARIWDAGTGKQLVLLRGHTDAVVSVAWSPDGLRILTASADKTARIWDAGTGAQLLVLEHSDAVTIAAWSPPDGSRILTRSKGETLPEIHVWDAKTGTEVLKRLTEDTLRITSANWSPDGTRIVAAGPDASDIDTDWPRRDRIALIWDVTNGALLVKLRGHVSVPYYPGYIVGVGWSSDGKRIVTASADKTARIWDAETGNQLAVLKGHTGSVDRAVYSRDGTRILTASDDKTVRIWLADTGRQIALVDGSSADWSPDGSRIVTARYDNKIARIWDARSDLSIAVLEGHTDAVDSAAWSPDGARIATAGHDGLTLIWEAKPGALPVQLEKNYNEAEKNPVWITSVAWNPSGSLIVTASAAGRARIWNPNTHQLLQVLAGKTGHFIYLPTRSFNSAAWSPDGSHIVAASGDDKARIWEPSQAGPHIAVVLQGHTGWVRDATWSPDGTRIVTASADKTARIWDAKTGSMLAVLKGHAEIVWSAAWSRDGAQIVTASADKTARIWDAKTGAQLAALEGHTAAVRSAAWSPDGRRIITASDDKTTRIWDPTTGATVAVIEGHLGAVEDAAWSPNSARIVTASDDKTVRIWEAWPLLTTDTIIYASVSAMRDLTTEERARMLLQSAKSVQAAGIAPVAPGSEVADMSIEQLRTAASAGDPYAHRRLAELYERGNRVAADLERALFHHTIEARLFEQAGNEEEAQIATARRGSDARALPPEVAVRVAREAVEWHPIIPH